MGGEKKTRINRKGIASVLASLFLLSVIGGGLSIYGFGVPHANDLDLYTNCTRSTTTSTTISTTTDSVGDMTLTPEPSATVIVVCLTHTKSTTETVTVNSTVVSTATSTTTTTATASTGNIAPFYTFIFDNGTSFQCWTYWQVLNVNATQVKATGGAGSEPNWLPRTDPNGCHGALNGSP